MTKKLRPYIAVIIFWIGFFVLFFVISEVFRAKVKGQTDMIHSFYRVEKETLDVIALGSSHAYCSLSPNVIWNETGITSFVMGSPQQSMASSYFLLKEALRYQKPKVVLLESYHFYYDVPYISEARLRQAFDGIRLGSVKHEMVETLLPELSIKEKLTFYLPFLKYHSRWVDLDKADFVNYHYTKGGWIVGTIAKGLEPQSADVPARTIPDVSIQYFEKIVELCRENDIQLVVFAAPLTKSKEFYRKQGFNVSLETYLQEKGIPFLFYQKTGELDIDFATDFKDRGHLNVFGQKKLSQNIAQYLAETYGLDGHKEDPRYTDWEKDYKQYEKRFKKLERKAKKKGQ